MFNAQRVKPFYSSPLTTETQYALYLSLQMTSRVFLTAGFRQSSIVGSLIEVGCAWASSASVRDDSVDFPNPILTCLQYVGLLALLSFDWIREKRSVKRVLSLEGIESIN